MFRKTLFWRSLFFSFVLSISAGIGDAQAYRFLRSAKNGRAYHWKRSRFPVPLLLDRSYPKGVNFGQVKGAVTASINTWNSVKCSAARLQLSGISPGLDAPKYDGKNIIKYLTTANEWRWSPLEFANTVITLNLRTGEILDADLVLNGWKFTWATDGSQGRADIQATVTHELGHVLGLDHTLDPGASMYAKANVGETGKRNLNNDDIKGLCELYPVQPCDEGKEVSGGLVCYNGRLVPICPPYYGDLCKDCSKGLHDACAGTKNFCLKINFKLRCGMDCSTTKSCPRGYTCVKVLGNNNQILGYNCIPDTKDCGSAPRPPCCRNNDDCLPGYSCVNSNCVRGKTCAKEGEACNSNSNCCGNLKCVDDGTGSKCRQPCDPLAPRCNGVLRCASIGGSTTQGACIPPNGGGKEGDKCDTKNNQCEYELGCDPSEKRCRYLCRPKQPGTCPSGYLCKPLGGSDQGPGLCYKQKSGTKCTTISDCPVGLICRNGYCSPCINDKDCPVRNLCRQGKCYPTCISSADCPRQHRCSQGLCQPGIPCTSDRDCTGGLICHQSICTDPSEKVCLSDKDCPAGQRCVEGSCRLPDSCNNRCAKNEVCSQGKCVPRSCQSDAQCGDGFICRGSRCVPEVENCGGKGPCPQGQECINDRCVGKIGYGCRGDEECSTNLSCVRGGELQICTQLCNPANPQSCPNGYFCAKLNNVGYACWPSKFTECKNNVCRPVEDGCGCDASGSGESAPLLFFLFFSLFGIALYRRSRIGGFNKV